MELLYLSVIGNRWEAPTDKPLDSVEVVENKY